VHRRAGRGLYVVCDGSCRRRERATDAGRNRRNRDRFAGRRAPRHQGEGSGRGHAADAHDRGQRRRSVRLPEPPHRDLHHHVRARRLFDGEISRDSSPGRSHRHPARQPQTRRRLGRRHRRGQPADERRRHHQWLHPRKISDRSDSPAHRQLHRRGDPLPRRQRRATRRHRFRLRPRQRAHLGQRSARHQQLVFAERRRRQHALQRQKHQPGRIGPRRQQHRRGQQRRRRS